MDDMFPRGRLSNLLSKALGDSVREKLKAVVVLPDGHNTSYAETGKYGRLYVRIDGQAELATAVYELGGEDVYARNGLPVLVQLWNDGEYHIAGTDAARVHAALLSPLPANFLPKQHNHENAQGGGQLGTNALLNQAVTTAKMARISVTDAILAANSVITTKIADGS